MIKIELVETSEEWVYPEEMDIPYFNSEYPDLYMADGACYIWMQFEPDESYDPIYEVYLTNISFLKKGHWLDREVSYSGFDCIFAPERSDFGAWFNFALKEGLYLFQPFLIAFDKPDWHRSNHPLDPEEWDVEYSWEIIYRVEPTAEMIEETMKFLSEALGQ